jgi:hypothetical protein
MHVYRWLPCHLQCYNPSASLTFLDEFIMGGVTGAILPPQLALYGILTSERRDFIL